MPEVAYIAKLTAAEGKRDERDRASVDERKEHQRPHRQRAAAPLHDAAPPDDPRLPWLATTRQKPRRAGRQGAVDRVARPPE